MKIINLVSATALATCLMGTISAHAAPQNAKQFKNAMQNASMTRLARNGSIVLRMDVDQDTTVNGVALLNSTLNANALSVDDSLISNLDVDQDATVRRTTMTNSSARLNSVDLTRARSIATEIDQDATLRGVSAANSAIAANTISIR